MSEIQKIISKTVASEAVKTQAKPTSRKGKAARTDKPAARDTVTISGKKGSAIGRIARKAALFPVRVLETAAGTVGAVASTAIHAPAGTLEGIHQGIAKGKDLSTGTFVFDLTVLAEFIGGGAAAGFMIGGPIGAAIGAGAGLLTGGIFRQLEGRADFPSDFCYKIEDVVEKATSDNQSDSKVKTFTQDVTEGAIIGTAVGMKEAWKGGYEAGKGVVSGISDVAEGVIEGIGEAVKFKDDYKPEGKGGQQ